MAIAMFGHKEVLVEKFMSPSFLSEKVDWNCDHVLQNKTHLAIKQDNVEYERIFRLKVLNKLEMPDDNKLLDFDISLSFGLEYTGTRVVKDPLTWSIANNRDHSIGIQLRDITEYKSLGPYVGVEGEPGRVLEHVSLSGEKQAETSNTSHWPRVFNISLKPMEQIGYCWSAIENGHLFTCNFDKHNPIVDPTQDDIYLDAYRFKKAETYTINFVKLTITIHTEKPFDSTKC